MQLLYTPEHADWVWEPSFIGPSLLYDQILLPLLQTGLIAPRHRHPDWDEIMDNRLFGLEITPSYDWKLRELSRIRSWWELPRQEAHLRKLFESRVVADCGGVTGEAIFDRGVYIGLSPEVAENQLRLGYRRSGLVPIHSFKADGAGAGEWTFANSLIPFDYRGDFAIPLDSPLRRRSEGEGGVAGDELLRSIFDEMIPEVFLERVQGLRRLGATKRNEHLPGLVDFVLEVRSRTDDGRKAFRNYVSILATLPWDGDRNEVEAAVGRVRAEIRESYEHYRRPLTMIVRRAGGIIKWISVGVSVLGHDWIGLLLGSATLATDALGMRSSGILGSTERRALAYLLEAERGMRSWARG